MPDQVWSGINPVWDKDLSSYGKLGTRAHDGRSIDSVSDHDLLVGICQVIFGFNPDAISRENIVKEARRRFHEVKAEVSKLEVVVAARDETIRELNSSIGARGTAQKMLDADNSRLRIENARLLAEVERLKADRPPASGKRSSRKVIRPTFVCLD